MKITTANPKMCPRCGGQMNRQSQMCKACYIEMVRRPEHYIPRECLECRQVFRVHITQIRAQHGIYCSQSCHMKHQNPNKPIGKTFFCENCGKPTVRRPCEEKKSATGMYFCGPECWYAYNVGPRHYLWGGGQDGRNSEEYREWRAAVIERDKGFCRLCRARQDLAAHHIVPWRIWRKGRYDVSNGITLCRSCHSMFQQHEWEDTKILQFIASVPVEVWEIPDTRKRVRPHKRPQRRARKYQLVMPL